MFGAASPVLAADATVYTGVTILDPVTQRRLPDHYIVVRGERIEAMGQGLVPERYIGAIRSDMRGRFAMPGLFDTHAHITLGPVAPKIDKDGEVSLVVAGNDAITRHDALMLLAAGVTTIRDTGGDTARMIAYREAVAQGRLRGPEARIAGAVIDRSAFPVTGLVDRVDDVHGVADLVKAQAAAGVDYVKLYEALTPEDLAAGIPALGMQIVEGAGHQAISTPPAKPKKSRKKVEAAKAMVSPNRMPRARRMEDPLSLMATPAPNRTTAITAAAWTTGPVIDCTTCWIGPSQGIPVPPASAVPAARRPLAKAAPNRRCPTLRFMIRLQGSAHFRAPRLIASKTIHRESMRNIVLFQRLILNFWPSCSQVPEASQKASGSPARQAPRLQEVQGMNRKIRSFLKHPV